MGTTYDQDELETDEESAGELVLLFTAEGSVQLEENGEPVWFSDDDDDFAAWFGDEFADADKDAADILNYLVDEGLLEEEEKAEVEIETEVDADGETVEKAVIEQ